MRTASLLLVLLLLPSLAFAERKVVANKHGCEISIGDRRDDGTDLAIAECSWSVAPDKVIATVKDAASHELLSSVESSDKLADGRIFQVHVASGISDRQVALQFTNTELADGGFRTEWTKASKQEPLVDGRIEVVVDDGAWEVHPAGDGTSKVRYELRYNAGGRIPNWVVQSFQKTGVAKICMEMRDAAAKK